jgi:hypothetical protein
VVVKKLRAVWRWTWRSVLVLLAIFAIFIFEENVRGRIMLARCKAELRAQGAKLTLAELDLPKPSAETNGAAALIAIADQLHQDTAETRETGSMPEEGFVFVKPGVAAVMHKQFAPIQKVYPSSSLKRSGTWHNANDAAFNHGLERAREILQQGPVEFELHYSAGMGMLLPHLARVRGLSRWFTASALVKLHDADITGALDCLEAKRKLADCLADERALVCQLVRIRIETSIFAVAWEIMQVDKLSDTELLRLLRICEMSDVTNEMIKAFERETIAWDQQYWDIKQASWTKELAEGVRSGNLFGEGWRTFPLIFRGMLWMTAWLDQDEQRALQLRYATLEEARQGVNAGCWDKARSYLPEEYWHGTSSWRYILSAFGPNIGWRKSVLNSFHVQTERELALTAIALKRYKLRSGQFPEDLSGLVPELLHQPPRDYMDGGSLRYRLNGDGTFTLYSVGDDCEDNGGDATPFEKHGSSYLFWYGRDAVWPRVATAEEIQAWETRRAIPDKQ